MTIYSELSHALARCAAGLLFIVPLLALLVTGDARSEAKAIVDLSLNAKVVTDAQTTALKRLKSAVELFEANEYREAGLLFDEVIRKRVLFVDDFAAYWFAESLFHQGRYAEAVKQLRIVVQDYPTSKWQDFALARLGDALLASGAWHEAHEIYVRHQQKYPDYPHPGALTLGLAKTKMKMEQYRAAADLLNKFIVEFPRHAYRENAERMLKRLQRRGVMPQRWSFEDVESTAHSLRRRRLHHESIRFVERSLRRTDFTPEQLWTLKYLHARALLSGRQFRQAIAVFADIEATAPSPAKMRLTHKWRSRAYEGLGDVNAAVKSQDFYWGTKSLYSPKRRIARGELYLRHGRHRESVKWFRGGDRLRTRIGRRLRILRPLSAKSSGDLQDAIRLFDDYDTLGFYPSAERKYWQARMLMNTDKSAVGIAALKSLVDADNGYYSAQAFARLQSLGVTHTQPSFERVSKASESLASAYKTNFGAALEGSQDTFLAKAAKIMVKESGDVLTELRSGYESLVINRQEDAIWHYRRAADELLKFHVSSAYRRNRWSYQPKTLQDFRKGGYRGPWGNQRTSKPIRSTSKRIRAFVKLDRHRLARQLSFIFSELGDQYYVLRLLKVGRSSTGRDETKSLHQWKRIYPQAYKNIVERECARYGLEPEVLWALMRTESRFNTLAVSPAEARGLMQVIWQTSQRISETGGFIDMGNAQILLPEVSIALGAWYISALLNKFEQQMPLAFAAYNAGPHRVASWLDRKPRMEMDQFVEEIQYEEARAYVKTVLSSLLMYRKIYHGNAGDWIDQTIKRRYAPEPDF